VGAVGGQVDLGRRPGRHPRGPGRRRWNGSPSSSRS
jgi:hypothetical protein